MKLKFLVTTVIMALSFTAMAFCDTDATLTPGTHSFTLTPYSVVAVQYPNYATGQGNGGNKIGSYTYKDATTGNNTTNTWHTYYKIKIDIPSIAESVSDIKIVYSTSSSKNYKFKIGVISGDNIIGEACYDDITNMTVLCSDVSYGSGNATSAALSDKISKNKQLYVFFAVMSENESSGDSYSTLDLSITGTYYISPAKVNLTVQNYPAGGQVGVGIDAAAQSVASPYNNTAFLEGSVVNISMIDQSIGGSYKGWDATSSWKKSTTGTPAFYANTRQANYTALRAEPTVAFTANLAQAYNLHVQYGRTGFGKVIVTKEGAATTIPVSTRAQDFIAAPQNPITVYAQATTINGIDYVFDHWSDGSTDNLHQPVSLNSDMILTATYIGTPNTSDMNVTSNGAQIGVHPTIYWTDNPNPNVTYQIYTVYGASSSTQTPVLRATVGRGVQSYTYTGNVTGTKGSDNLLSLYLRQVYSVENTYSTILGGNFYLVNGDVTGEGPGQTGKIVAKENQNAVVTQYAVANYPNPFNPTTVVNYQVPQAGRVTLKVYDIMGREIATLVDENKEMGSYNVNFSMDKYRLSSGVYFCRMIAGKTMITNKMILSK
jgi:hypothetical protein